MVSKLPLESLIKNGSLQITPVVNSVFSGLVLIFSVVEARSFFIKLTHNTSCPLNSGHFEHVFSMTSFWKSMKSFCSIRQCTGKFYYIFYIFLTFILDCESLILSSLIGYQKISPDIFLQVNFNPAKLLPALTSDDGSCDHDNSVLSLKLNIGAHRANFNQVGIL